ncbi:MAG: hypothetical protein ACI4V7_10085 [Succinivibrionaceae bacterium]
MFDSNDYDNLTNDIFVDINKISTILGYINNQNIKIKSLENEKEELQKEINNLKYQLNNITNNQKNLKKRLLKSLNKL